MPTSAVEFHEEAQAEYDAAFAWYLSRSIDAAIEFDAQVNRAIDLIRIAPETWPVGSFSSRKFLIHKFPYLLIYRIKTPNRIEVIALAHTSRKPGYWRKRL